MVLGKGAFSFSPYLQGRDFLNSSAEIVHFVMRVFLMLAFRAMAGQFHPQFRRHVLIGKRGCEAVAQGVRVTISGGAGDDAKHYQERDVRRALAAVK